MRLTMIGTALLSLSLLAVPAAALPLAKGIIQPGASVGPVAVGQDVGMVLSRMGTPDFQQNNDDGTVLYEWGLLEQSAALPDATLWVLIDGDKVTKIGTDGPAGFYKDDHGLGVGNAARAFIEPYGFPDKNPAPGFYKWTVGLGIVVSQHGEVHTVWVEASDSSSQPAFRYVDGWLEPPCMAASTVAVNCFALKAR